jgi:hypothetical protein
MRYKFKTVEEYNKWCEDMITKIYYAQIAMNDEAIREVVHEVGMKLWIPEGCSLIKNGGVEEDDVS